LRIVIDKNGKQPRIINS